MKMKKAAALICVAGMLASLASGCSVPSDKAQKEVVKEAEGTAKEDLPLAKYPETVTVHMGGKMNPNAKISEGMSFDNNSYTRLLKDELNIEVVYDWVASMSDFDEKTSLCIGSNTVPEVMNVTAAQYRALLKYDMIQPLDQYFDDYASDALKSYIESGGEELMKCITNEDGEIMAIPAPNLTAGGINEMWIRQDWLDALDLEAPRTWDELAKVAEAFVSQDPDGNGEEDTIGILGPGNADHMNAVGGNQFGIDPLFSSYQSYPQYWLEGKDGTIEYGSIQPETKTALEQIAKLYAGGLIDPEMLVRSDSKEPLLAGKVGIFFGPWWCAYTFADTTLSGEADWRAYFTPLSEDGKYYTHMAEPTTQYVVASKDCANPEAAFKIINFLIANEQAWVEEGVSSTEMGTADFYPLYNTYDNADEIETSYEVLTKYLAGEIGVDDVDFSTHKLLKSDMEAVTELKKEPYDDFSLQNWNLDSEMAKGNLPRLVAIMVGDAPLVNEEYVPVYNMYNGQTETMEAKWANLKKMEEETFAKIIMGKADISEFDTFVKNWKSQGGDQILKEINVELGK
ncbi:multiple sugar transport system substrate-binding protein [Dorea sp. 5-2]|nr:multiple sugar transport system substrate-binding protein [Dorea sp. 5-2]